MIFSHLIYPSLLSIASDQVDPDPGVSGKIAQDGIRIGASAGGKDRESDHGFLPRPIFPASLVI